MWALIMSDCPMRQKLAAMAKFVVDTLGLHYAREQTHASIVGVIVAAHAKPVTYKVAHDYLNEFKVYAGEQRKKRLSRQGLAWYPPSIADFMAFEPDRYSPGEPPVECPMSAAMIVSGRHLVGARCGNKKLMVGNPSVARNEQGAGSIAAVDDQECEARRRTAKVGKTGDTGRRIRNVKITRKRRAKSIVSQHRNRCPAGRTGPAPSAPRDRRRRASSASAGSPRPSRPPRRRRGSRP